LNLFNGIFLNFPLIIITEYTIHIPGEPKKPVHSDFADYLENTIFLHTTRQGWVYTECFYSAYKTHGTEAAKIANRLQMSSMEDFGVLPVWGFRGNSDRFFSVGMGLKSNPHGSHGCW